MENRIIELHEARDTRRPEARRFEWRSRDREQRYERQTDRLLRAIPTFRLNQLALRHSLTSNEIRQRIRLGLMTMPLQLLEAWPQLELSEITTAINVGQAARQIGLSPASLEIPVRRTQNTGLRKGLEDQLLLLYSLGRLIEASPPLRNSIEKQGIQESTALIIEAINTLLFLSTQAQRNIRTTLKAEEKGSSPRLHPLRIIELLIDAAKVAGETKDPRELNDPIALAFILQRMIKEQADSETNQPDFLAAA